MAAGCADEFANVESLQAPAARGSAQVHLARTHRGAVLMSWLETQDSQTALKFAVLQSDGWGAERIVAQGSNWLSNWADFPSVVPLSESLWGAHWLVRQPGGMYAYDVVVAVSQDAGLTWSAGVTPHTDSTPTEHGFVALFPRDTAKTGVLWLDGRDRMNAAHDKTGAVHGVMMRASSVDADGASPDDQVVDALVCDCCQPDVAMARSGPVVVYRDRTVSEVRDIAMTRLVDGQWDDPKVLAQDDWVISGCPVNGPAIDVWDNTLMVAWYTEADDRPLVRLAFSGDGGDSFAAPITVDSVRPLGRVDLVAVAEDRAVVGWISGGDRTAFVAQEIGSDGILGKRWTVAVLESSERAGFPQLEMDQRGLVAAWNELVDGDMQVRSARLLDF